MSNVWCIPDSKHDGSKCSLPALKKTSDRTTIALVSLTFVTHNRPYLGSAGNTCNLTPSLVVLLHPAAKHLVGIAEKMQKNVLCMFVYSTHCRQSLPRLTSQKG